MLFAAGPKAVLLRQPQFFLQLADARLQRGNLGRVCRKLCQQASTLGWFVLFIPVLNRNTLATSTIFWPHLSRRSFRQQRRIKVLRYLCPSTGILPQRVRGHGFDVDAVEQPM